MTKRTAAQARILKQLSLAFARNKRRNHGRQTYSPQLRDMALGAIDAGIGAKSVAKVAGISAQSVLNWKRHVPAPRELKLVATVEAAPAPALQKPVGAPVTARVTLRSGALIEVPASALTVELIAALNVGAL
jgi:hypothetical protein